MVTLIENISSQRNKSECSHDNFEHEMTMGSKANDQICLDCVASFFVYKGSWS